MTAEPWTECAKQHMWLLPFAFTLGGMPKTVQSVPEDLLPWWLPSCPLSWLPVCPHSWPLSSGQSRPPSCNQLRSVSHGSKHSCSRCDSSKISKLDGSAHSKRNSKHSLSGASQNANDQGMGTGRHSLRTAPDSLNRVKTLAICTASCRAVPCNGNGPCHRCSYDESQDRLLNVTQPPLHHASSSPISLIGIGSLGLLLATKLDPLWVVASIAGLLQPP